MIEANSNRIFICKHFFQSTKKLKWRFVLCKVLKNSSKGNVLVIDFPIIFQVYIKDPIINFFYGYKNYSAVLEVILVR